MVPPSRIGIATFSNPILVRTAPVGAQFTVSPVSPNPSCGMSVVSFAVPRGAPVRLSVMDLQGCEIAVLADGLRQRMVVVK